MIVILIDKTIESETKINHSLFHLKGELFLSII